VTEYSFLILSFFTHTTSYNFVTKKIKITWAEAAIVLVFFFWVLLFLGYKESWVVLGFGARVFLFSVWPCRNLVHFSKRLV
jgi:hypothetical protein